MKYLLFILGLLIFLPTKIPAQHCPFDGGHLIVIHLTDGKGKPILNPTKNLILKEIDNPVADRCSFSTGLLAKDFLPTKTLLQTKYKNYWKDWIEPDYKDWNLLTNGYYAVSLNQAEETCMIKNNGDYNYRKRKFEIHFKKNGRVRVVKVEKENIFALCTNAGKWTRIQPIEIIIK